MATTDINQILAQLLAGQKQQEVQPAPAQTSFSKLNLDNPDIKNKYTQVGTKADGTPIYGELMYNQELIDSMTPQRGVDGIIHPKTWFNSIQKLGTLDELMGLSSPSSTSGASGSAGGSGTKASESRSSSYSGLSPEDTLLARAQLIKLLNGGSPEQQDQYATFIKDMSGAKDEAMRLLKGYTKESAIADSQGLMDAQMRKSLESVMPGVTQTTGGAGAGNSSVTALLKAQAATRAAEAASALGAQQATQYGDLSAKFASLLGNLSAQAGNYHDPKQDDIAKLLQILHVSDSSATQDSWHAPIVPQVSGGGGGGRAPIPQRGIYDSAPIDLSKDPFFQPKKEDLAYGARTPEYQAYLDAPSPRYYPEYSNRGAGYITNNTTGTTTLIGD